jgi:hypothetical protein
MSSSHPFTAIARRAVLMLALLLLAPAPSQSITSVDCDTPDDFCTGDPCTTADDLSVTVAACVLDFSPRALVLTGKVLVGSNGTLTLTAGAITAQGTINGAHVGGAGNGADVSLTASGNISVDRRIDVSGRDSVGTITIDASGNVSLGGRLVARARGPGAVVPGGAVTVHADGTVVSVKLGKIDVRGKSEATAGGQISVSGDAGVDLGGRLDARGAGGGVITIASTSGDIVVADQ